MLSTRQNIYSWLTPSTFDPAGSGRVPMDYPMKPVTTALEQAVSIKYTFLRLVPLDTKRFAESGVSLMECPNCGRTWTLSPRGGVVRFRPHNKRTTTTSNSAERWAMRETLWKVVGGENE
jgi:hypothetical protein